MYSNAPINFFESYLTRYFHAELSTLSSKSLQPHQFFFRFCFNEVQFVTNTLGQFYYLMLLNQMVN